MANVTAKSTGTVRRLGVVVSLVGVGALPSTVALQQVAAKGAGSVTPVTSGVPASASAVLTNLTMVDGAAPGYITADKCSALVPGPQSKSNGNHGVDIAIANLSVVSVDPDSRFCIFNQQPVNLIADVQGYFAAPAAGGQQFFPTAPTRKIDTRIAPLTRPAAGSITRIETGAPAGTAAVLVNLTMVEGVGTGYITADRCSALTPGAQTKSSGNHSESTAIANEAVVPVDVDGSFCIYNQKPVHLVVDLQGSFITSTAGLNFTSIAPARKLDTRSQSVPVTAGTITKVTTGAVAGTDAVLVNLTMSDGAGSGFITADKCSTLTGGPQTKSSGNHPAGTAIANLAVVPVDPDGSFCIFNQQTVNLVVDLQGSFSAAGTQQFYPTAPTRVIDSRPAPYIDQPSCDKAVWLIGRTDPITNVTTFEYDVYNSGTDTIQQINAPDVSYQNLTTNMEIDPSTCETEPAIVYSTEENLKTVVRRKVLLTGVVTAPFNATSVDLPDPQSKPGSIYYRYRTVIAPSIKCTCGGLDVNIDDFSLSDSGATYAYLQKVADMFIPTTYALSVIKWNNGQRSRVDAKYTKQWSASSGERVYDLEVSSDGSHIYAFHVVAGQPQVLSELVNDSANPGLLDFVPVLFDGSQNITIEDFRVLGSNIVVARAYTQNGDGTINVEVIRINLSTGSVRDLSTVPGVRVDDIRM